MRYTSNRGYVLYSGINNIFDEKYYSYIGDSFATVIPCDGKTFYFGINYTF